MGIEDLLGNAESYASEHGAPDLPLKPARQLAVVACMDSRLDLFAILGLKPGEAHLIRNAGGVVTDDVIRSLALSQRLLETREVILIHHTDCGLLKIREDDFREELRRETGQSPTWAVEAFTDVDEDVRNSMLRLQGNPFLPHVEAVRGFVFEVETGRLREVLPAS